MVKTKTVAKAAKEKMPVKQMAKKTAPAEGGMKKKNRVKAGTNALREIRRYQKSLNNMLPRAAFQRLVRGITADAGGHDLRF